MCAFSLTAYGRKDSHSDYSAILVQYCYTMLSIIAISQSYIDFILLDGCCCYIFVVFRCLSNVMGLGGGNFLLGFLA